MEEGATWGFFLGAGARVSLLSSPRPGPLPKIQFVKSLPPIYRQSNKPMEKTPSFLLTLPFSHPSYICRSISSIDFRKRGPIFFALNIQTSNPTPRRFLVLQVIFFFDPKKKTRQIKKKLPGRDSGALVSFSHPPGTTPEWAKSSTDFAKRADHAQSTRRGVFLGGWVGKDLHGKKKRRPTCSGAWGARGPPHRANRQKIVKPQRRSNVIPQDKKSRQLSNSFTNETGGSRQENPFFNEQTRKATFHTDPKRPTPRPQPTNRSPPDADPHSRQRLGRGFLPASASGMARKQNRGKGFSQSTSQMAPANPAQPPIHTKSDPMGARAKMV